MTEHTRHDGRPEAGAPAGAAGVLAQATAPARPVPNPETVMFGRLWHVGTLNGADKWVRGGSYEGTGLSVSLHPEDWRAIAQLGDTPTWEIDTADLTLVDVYALDDSDTAAIMAWAETEGLVTPEPGWRITWYDDEFDQEMSTTTLSDVEAQDHLDEGAEVEEINTWAPTDLLHEAAGHTVREGDVEGQALIVYFDQCHPDVDGLWWDDAHDPDRLTAPRGVLFPRTVPNVEPQPQPTVTEPDGYQPGWDDVFVEDADPEVVSAMDQAMSLVWVRFPGNCDETCEALAPHIPGAQIVSGYLDTAQCSRL